MSDIATTTDAKLMAAHRLRARRRRSTPLPPPLRDIRRDRLDARQPVLQPAQHRADASSASLLIVWIVPPLVKFLFIDAVWNGTDRDDCLPRPEHPEVGACWAFVHRPHQLLHLRLLSDRRALAGRCVLRAARGRHRLAGCGSTRRAAISARSISSSSMPIASLILLLGLAADRPAARSTTTLWGGMLVTIVVSVGRHRVLAADRHPAGARPPLATCRRCGCSR